MITNQISIKLKKATVGSGMDSPLIPKAVYTKCPFMRNLNGRFKSNIWSVVLMWKVILQFFLE